VTFVSAGAERKQLNSAVSKIKLELLSTDVRCKAIDRTQEKPEKKHALQGDPEHESPAMYLVRWRRFSQRITAFPEQCIL